jgi:hypothetical protein
MSKSSKIRELTEQKKLLMAKADLQRSTFLMLAAPIFKVIRAAEVGFMAVRTGRAVVRQIKRR